MEITRISLELTNQCNLDCGLCSRKNVVTEPHYLTPEAIENLNLDILSDIKVTIYGRQGDPILNPYMLDIAKIFKKSNTTTSIGTNGTMRSEDWWYNLPKHLPPIHDIAFAIDGADAETYSYYRRGGKFDKVIANMKAFIKGGGQATWQFILFDHNQDQIDEIKKLSKKYGCYRYRIIPSNRYDSIYKKPTIYQVKSNDEARFMATISCRMEIGEIFVACTGYYHPCCLFLRFGTVIRFIHVSNLKNIYEVPLIDIIKTKYYDSLYEKSKTFAFCKTCNVMCGQRFVSNECDIEEGLARIAKI